MNDQRDERELEAYLAGDSPVSRQYAELPDAQPPPALDAQILAAAEAEVKVVPFARPWRRWATAVGVAATVMLAFTVVMQVAIKPFSEPDSSPPPAAVVLMEEAERQQEVGREKQEAPRAASPVDRIGMPAAPPGRVADDAAREALRDELAPAAMQRDLADMDQQVKVTATVNAPEPEAFAGAEMQVGKPDIVDAGRMAKAAAVIRESRLAPANAAQRRRSDARVAAKSVDADGVASEALDADAAEARLDEVLRLYDDGDIAGAAERLAEFRTEYPAHPVSLRLADALD